MQGLETGILVAIRHHVTASRAPRLPLRQEFPPKRASAPASSHPQRAGLQLSRVRPLLQPQVRTHPASRIPLGTLRCHDLTRVSSCSDLLRRHAGIHGAAAAVPDSRRGRACDTCHANKTKCDGGPQCSLCMKRGVTCTYGRRDGSSPATQLRGSPRSQGSPAELATGSAPVSPPFTDPDLASSGAPVSLPAAELSGSASSEHEGFTTKSALQSILRAVASRSGKAPDAATQPSAVPKSWLVACVESYFGNFHDRWPILHAPSLDETTDSVALIASVVMINSWLHYDRGLREVIMEIHNHLVEQSFRQLVSHGASTARECD